MTKSLFGRVALVLGATAALGAACGDRPTPPPAGSGAGPGADAGAATAAPKRAPITTRGSAVALLPDEGTLVVADEDHGALVLAAADLSPRSTRFVALPGRPAEIVATDGVVFVTVRSLPTDAGRPVHEQMRGPLPDPAGATALSPTKVLVPDALKPRGAGATSPAAPASASASAAATPSAPPRPRPSASAYPSARAEASASARAEAPKPSPPAKKGTPPLTIDPSLARQSRGGLLVALATDPDRGLVEIGRVTLAPDAWGLSLTPDTKRAVVTSAWAHEVSVVDVADPRSMRVVSHDSVAREPRGVAISPDGKTAFVSHLVGTAVTRIDGLDAAPKVSVVALPAAPSRTRPGTTPGASLAYSLVLSPDGSTLYVPRHALGADGIGAWWGAPTVDALDVPSGRPLAPPFAPHGPSATTTTQSLMQGPPWTAQTSLPPSPSLALVQPRAVVYRKSTGTLLVASEGDDAVAELGTHVPDPAMDVEAVYELGRDYDLYGHYPTRGGGPSGLALSRDDGTLWVLCRTTFDLARIDLATSEVSWLHFADDALPHDAALGRRLFANAKSNVVSGGLGCAACHPEGRDDAYVWREGSLQSFSGLEDRFVGARAILKRMSEQDDPDLVPRQTPMLAGRVRADGPYGWHGQNRDLLERLVEGFHLHRAAWDSSGTDTSIGQDVAKIDYIADFIRSGLVPPPTLVRELTDEEKKGKAVYEGAKAQCNACHLADGGSDRKVVTLAELPVRGDFSREKNQAFKVPSLTFLEGTAPYLHDGSQPTLEDLVRNNGQRMGDTGHLSPDEQTALVAYLRTL